MTYVWKGGWNGSIWMPARVFSLIQKAQSVAWISSAFLWCKQAFPSPHHSFLEMFKPSQTLLWSFIFQHLNIQFQGSKEHLQIFFFLFWFTAIGYDMKYQEKLSWDHYNFTFYETSNSDFVILRQKSSRNSPGCAFCSPKYTTHNSYLARSTWPPRTSLGRWSYSHGESRHIDEWHRQAGGHLCE